MFALCSANICVLYTMQAIELMYRLYTLLMDLPHGQLLLLSAGYKEMGSKGGSVTNEDTGNA